MGSSIIQDDTSLPHILISTLNIPMYCILSRSELELIEMTESSKPIPMVPQHAGQSQRRIPNKNDSTDSKCRTLLYQKQSMNGKMHGFFLHNTV